MKVISTDWWTVGIWECHGESVLLLFGQSECDVVHTIKSLHLLVVFFALVPVLDHGDSHGVDPLAPPSVDAAAIQYLLWSKIVKDVEEELRPLDEPSVSGTGSCDIGLTYNGTHSIIDEEDKPSVCCLIVVCRRASKGFCIYESPGSSNK